MRFSYAESMIDPSFYVPLARAAEDAGYDTMVVPDSVCYPAESDATYPYSPDGTREFLEDKPFIEPFTLVPALGAVTERLRFTTFVVKLPIREPVLVAKQATSIAVLTDNRFALGVGTSPWPEDYRVTNVAWEGRGRRMTEMMEVIRGLGSGDWFSYEGDVFSIPSIKIAPVPTEPLPLLVGGHAEPALRRAARLADGWMHGGGDPADLPRLLARLRDLRKEYGREDEPFEVHVISMDAFSVDGVRRLEDAGVTDVIVGFRWPYETGPDTEPLVDKQDALRRFSDDVIAKGQVLTDSKADSGFGIGETRSVPEAVVTPVGADDGIDAPGQVRNRAPLWPYYLVVFLMTSGIGAVFTLLGQMRDELGLDNLGIGLIASSGFFAVLVAQITLSRYADRGYSILMIRIGLATAVLSMLLMTVGSELWVLVLARSVLGAGTGLVIPAARRIVISADPENVGTNIGRLGSADIAGFAFGPALAAVAASVAGLRAPFVLLGLLIVVCAPLAARAAVDTGKLDTERRPVRHLLRIRPLVSVMVVAIGFYLMIGTFDATWALLMTDNGADTWLIGLTITVFALPMIVIAPMGGRLAQRRGPIRAATAGLLLAVPCVLSYGFVTSIAVLAVVSFVQSMFDAITFPATQVGVAVATPPEQLAASQGLLGAAELGAAGTMALVAGFMYDAWGAQSTFVVTSVLMAICAVAGFALAGGRLRPADQSVVATA